MCFCFSLLFERTDIDWKGGIHPHLKREAIKTHLAMTEVAKCPGNCTTPCGAKCISAGISGMHPMDSQSGVSGSSK